MKSVIEQLAEMRHLPPGWDSYGAPMINRGAIAEAQSLFGLLLGNWCVVPCPDGSVQIERHQGGYDVEIRISASAEANGDAR